MSHVDADEITKELDMEFLFERESLPYKLSRGASGMQIHAKYCPACGDSRNRVYLNAETGIGNCLAGNTEILTREYGSVTIEEVSGETVTLLDGNGNWTSCEIKDHGIQETFEHSFNGLRGSVSIRSTAEHGWIDVDGDILLRKDLKRGVSKIADLRHDRKVRDTESYSKGVIHGLFYGDGSKEERGNYRMRVCSHHESIIPFLSRFSFKMIDGDPRYYIPKTEAWCELKQLPDNPGVCLDYLMGFLRGWLATDGCVGLPASATICAGEDEIKWIRKWAPLIGWGINGATKLSSVTNFGKRNKEVFNLNLSTRSMSHEDFLVKQHRERWLNNKFYPAKREWTPKGEWIASERRHSKNVNTRFERVYCPVVPTTHSFALSCGIHSRNCFVCNQTFNKLTFIKEHFQLDWRQTFETAKEILKEQGWRPKRIVAAAVEYGEVKLPYSTPLPTEDGQNLQYLENRGITAEYAKYFNLRYCEFGWWAYAEDGVNKRQPFDNRVIIPVFDLDGTLMTFQGRDLNPPLTQEQRDAGLTERKYLFPKALPGTGRFLLNGQNFVAATAAVMGEGFFDVAAIKIAFDAEQDLRGVVPVGSFGKHLSYGAADGNDQLGRFLQLKSKGLKQVTIMWDGEEKALTAAMDAAKLLTGIGLTVKIALLPAGKDPNEVLPEVVVAAYRDAQVWTPKLDIKWRLRNPYKSAT